MVEVGLPVQINCTDLELSCRFSEHSVIKFPETSFLDSAAYMNEDETTERIGWYGDIMNGRRANDVFKVTS